MAVETQEVEVGTGVVGVGDGVIGVLVGTGVVGVADGVIGVFVFVNVYVGVFVAAACTETVKTSVDFSPQAFVYVAVKVSVPTLKGILSISREVEVNPLGPVQLQEPPVNGCGPRLTVEEVEVTEALLVCCHAPPFTWIYGVMGVVAHGVAVLVGVKVDVGTGVVPFVWVKLYDSKLKSVPDPPVNTKNMS